MEAKARQRPRKACVTAWANNTKYALIQNVMEQMGMVSLDDENFPANAHLLWSDSATAVTFECVRELQRYQRINHFPGMEEICRKDTLARNMARIRRICPKEYGFTPMTWILPSDYHSLVLYGEDESMEGKGPKTFIAKPANGAMGNGIYLFRNPDRLLPLENMVVQNYLEHPFLLDGYKIDLRLYVLITRCDPLRAFLYKDGLVRLGTEKYTKPSGRNMDSVFMHLTNYSVNKCHENFQRNSNYDRGSKRSVKSLMKYLSANGHDINTVWRKIVDVLVKTLIVACPHIAHSYRACRPGDATHSDSVCFEVLGFDIFLDEKLNPWLLEVNRTPSFGTDEQVDHDIKSGVLQEAFQLLNIRPCDKAKSKAEDKAEAQRRLFRPTRKPDHDEKKEIMKERREKNEKDAEREEHENDTMKNYFRIFPSSEKTQQKKYDTLLQKSFKLFTQSKPTSFKTGNKHEKDHQHPQRRARKHHETRPHTHEAIRGHSDRAPLPFYRQLKSEGDSTREHKIHGHQHMFLDRTHHRNYYAGLGSLSLPKGIFRDVPKVGILTEEEMTAKTLAALEEVRIKFPGKSDMDARRILNRIIRNWEVNKSGLASYWLVELDSVKRRKVIAIVRDNIKPIVRRTFRTTSVDALKLMRYFDRIFNRMWSDYGRWLWDCFGENGDSWETVFSNEKLTDCELDCCRRVVELCKDCLLIVYQFAKEVQKLVKRVPQSTAPTALTAAPGIYDRGDVYTSYSQQTPKAQFQTAPLMPAAQASVIHDKTDIYSMFSELTQSTPSSMPTSKAPVMENNRDIYSMYSDITRSVPQTPESTLLTQGPSMPHRSDKYPHRSSLSMPQSRPPSRVPGLYGNSEIQSTDSRRRNGKPNSSSAVPLTLTHNAYGKNDMYSTYSRLSNDIPKENFLRGLLTQ